MQYYKLSYSIEPKVVGVRDGLGICLLDESFYERHPWYKELFITAKYDASIQPPTWWQRLAALPDHGRPLRGIKVEKRAKLTDFIDFGGFAHGYLVSDRLRGILEQAHLPRHKYFPATLQLGEREIGGYWWLCYDLETGQQNVDFARSKMKNLLGNEKALLGSELGIITYADYLSHFNEHNQALKATVLHLNTSFDRSLDIWGTQFLTLTKGYISERLLKLFEHHSIKGYDVRKIGSTLKGTTRHALEQALVFA